MPKNIDDMIVPERRRSIRDIPIPEGRRKNSDSPPLMDSPIPPTEPPKKGESYGSDFHNERKRFTKIPKKGVWLGAILAVLLLFFAVLSIFNGATLSYLPKSATVSFDNDIYTAEKSGEGVLLYSVIKISSDKGTEVSASGEEEVSRKASGQIIVFNNASTQSQKLRATTRFETPDGKVYQVKDAIVVPGKKVIGGVEEPGMLEVTVYAQDPGEEFNIGLTDFTLPGLRGTSLFTTIYARSKTEMSGGFVGVEKVVSDSDRTQAKTDLEASLREELISEARAQAPEGFVLLPNLSLITFEDLPQTSSSKKDTVTVNIRGNLNGVMFKEADLSTHLTLRKTTLAPNDTVVIKDLETLNFSFSDTSPADILLSDKINFSVSGTGTAVWIIDETALRADLVGKHKKDIPSILSNYPNVESVTATISPFWKRAFPSDGSRIMLKKLEVN